MKTTLSRPGLVQILAGQVRSRSQFSPFGFLAMTFLFACLALQGVAAPSGELLPVAPSGLTVWWALSSAAKIQPDAPPPAAAGTAVTLRCARNETEAAQLVLRSASPISDLRISCAPLSGPGGATIDSSHFEVLQAAYLNLTRPTDGSTKAGWWPDPLLPIGQPLELGPGSNHIFWLRVFVPRETPAGLFKGTLRLSSRELSFAVPIQLTVYGFTLPDRMTCATAFGFSPGEVFRYHGLKTDEHKRLVLEKYLANLAAHHVSPYDPAPLDPIRVTWPDVRPPKSIWDDWVGLRIVTNEFHSGKGALLIYDDQPESNVTVSYDPLIPIPPKGLKFHAWFRTPVPGHRFSVSFNHHDANRQWMSGRNNDLAFVGTGSWQELNETFTSFPDGAAFVRLHLRATTWTDQGEHIGLVWCDDLSLTDAATQNELLTGGHFELKPRTELAADPEKLEVRLDFENWDRAMDRAMNLHHFTSFQVNYPGLGGGTFHAIDAPNLLGFQEQDPEYPLLMASYGQQLEAHLRERGWLERAFVYWFDEPSPDQYPFVMNGFNKLKQYSPGITRMLTEQVEPGLIGGPNLWCPISNEYKQEAADTRRKLGEKFWWYVCTGPKAPYAGLFIDHPAPEMRIWVWQTWQRGIDGLLVWQINYWTSSAAYPDRDKPQNPYQDPMSWTSGYSTPAGRRLPWGNGDGRFIYPPTAAAAGNPASPVLDGPVDSIRWEHLRDGIEDYEYFCILRQRVDTAKTRASSEQTDALARLLVVPESISGSMTQFAADGTAIEAHRHAVALAIEKLR